MKMYFPGKIHSLLLCIFIEMERLFVSFYIMSCNSARIIKLLTEMYLEFETRLQEIKIYSDNTIRVVLLFYFCFFIFFFQFYGLFKLCHFCVSTFYVTNLIYLKNFFLAFQSNESNKKIFSGGECTCNATTILNLLKRDIDFGESIRGPPGTPGKDGKAGVPGLTVI